MIIVNSIIGNSGIHCDVDFFSKVKELYNCLLMLRSVASFALRLKKLYQYDYFWELVKHSGNHVSLLAEMQPSLVLDYQSYSEWAGIHDVRDDVTASSLLIAEDRSGCGFNNLFLIIDIATLIIKVRY